MKKNRFKTALFFTLAFLAKGLYSAYINTLQITVVNPDCSPKAVPSDENNIVFVFWHSKSFILMPYWAGARIGILTLLDPMNFFYDKLSQLYGYKTVPMANAGRATVKLTELLKKRFHVALAVDGPAGPRGIVKPGALYIAQKSNKPMIVIRVDTDRRVRLKKRWDRYEIPLPFSRTVLTLSDPIPVDGLATGEIESKLRHFLGPS